MILLVSGATATLRRYPAEQRLGHLITPSTGNAISTIVATGRPWAADNGAFTGFDADAFRRMLELIRGNPRCLFVTCPDAVGDARATAMLFETWAPTIRDLGLPVAWVAQDGAEDLPRPWDRGGEIPIRALFIGGSTRWKLGRPAADLAAEARRRSIWVHMGRVNTRRRFVRAAEIGCDSVDGSGFSRWPDERIPKALRWLDYANNQRTFFTQPDHG